MRISKPSCKGGGGTGRPIGLPVLCFSTCFLRIFAKKIGIINKKGPTPLPFPPVRVIIQILFGGVAQLVRVPASHAGGPGFEPQRVHQSAKARRVAPGFVFGLRKNAGGHVPPAFFSGAPHGAGGMRAGRNKALSGACPARGRAGVQRPKWMTKRPSSRAFCSN